MKSHLKPYFGELFGTAILVLLGDAVIAQVLLSDHLFGDWLSVNISWASGLFLSSFMSNPSPTVNPAVTIALCVFRKKSNQWRRGLIQVFCQVLGAFIAAALVYAVYFTAIDVFEKGTRTVPGGSILSDEKDHSTAGIFATYPASYLSMPSAVLSEFVGSLVLMFGVLAIGDSAHSSMVPFANFILLLSIGCALGWQTGYAINPARDLGPRVLSYLAGYSSEVFTVGPHYWLIPLFVPFAGCLVGAFFYDMFIYEGDDSSAWLASLRSKVGIDAAEGDIRI